MILKPQKQSRTHPHARIPASGGELKIAFLNISDELKYSEINLEISFFSLAGSFFFEKAKTGEKNKFGEDSLNVWIKDRQRKWDGERENEGKVAERLRCTRRIKSFRASRTNASVGKMFVKWILWFYVTISRSLRSQEYNVYKYTGSEEASVRMARRRVT